MNGGHVQLPKFRTIGTPGRPIKGSKEILLYTLFLLHEKNVSFTLIFFYTIFLDSLDTIFFQIYKIFFTRKSNIILPHF